MRVVVHRETGTAMLGERQVSRAWFRLVRLRVKWAVVSDKQGNQRSVVCLRMEKMVNLCRCASLLLFPVVSACHKWDTLLFQAEVPFHMTCNP